MMESESVKSSSPSKPWSQTRRGQFAIILGMMGLFVLVFWMAMKSRRMVADPGVLVVDDQYLSFGEVWEEPAFGWTLPIHNTTNEDVEIDGFAADCPCVKIEPRSITVSAQGTVNVHLTLDLRTPPTSELDLIARDFKVHVKPHLNRGSKPQPGWSVRGKVMQPFAIEPPMVDFEESLIRGQSFAPRSATITCRMAVAELRAECDSPSLKAHLTRDTKNLRQFRLEVQPQENMPAGFLNYPVRLAAVTPSKTKVRGVVSVVGRVLDDIELVPEVLTFGAEPVGSKLQETVLLRSRSGQDFAIQEIDKGGVAGMSVAVGQKRTNSRPLVISGVVHWLGYQEFTIHVKVKTRQGLLDLSLPVSCHGVPTQKEDER